MNARRRLVLGAGTKYHLPLGAVPYHVIFNKSYYSNMEDKMGDLKQNWE